MSHYRTRRPQPDPSPFTTCTDCRKRAYPTRKAAKATAKTISGRHMTAYPCPVADGFHLGHLPMTVVHGYRDKLDYVQSVEQQRGQAS